MKLFKLAMVAFFSAGALAAEQEVNVRVEPVAGNVSMLVGSGGNIGVLAGEDGVILIDDQFAPLTEKIRQAVQSIDKGPIRFVLNTHWHFDHTGGNENFGKAGTVIVAHNNVRQRMSTDQLMAFFKREVKASPKEALPVITFGQDIQFHLNGEQMEVIHMPHAHTDGDAIVFFKKANVVHMGDIYFAQQFPFIDVGSGGSVHGVIAAINKVIERSDEKTKIIPGHGQITDVKVLGSYRDMLVNVRDRVAKAKSTGKTLEAFVAEKPIADLDVIWGKGFIKADQLLNFVWNSASAHTH